jgi:hypothetical protein
VGEKDKAVLRTYCIKTESSNNNRCTIPYLPQLECLLNLLMRRPHLICTLTPEALHHPSLLLSAPDTSRVSGPGARGSRGVSRGLADQCPRHPGLCVAPVGVSDRGVRGLNEALRGRGIGQGEGQGEGYWRVSGGSVAGYGFRASTCRRGA